VTIWDVCVLQKVINLDHVLFLVGGNHAWHGLCCLTPRFTMITMYLLWSYRCLTAESGVELKSPASRSGLTEALQLAASRTQRRIPFVLKYIIYIYIIYYMLLYYNIYIYIYYFII
jgi:hypothetical protein